MRCDLLETCTEVYRSNFGVVITRVAKHVYTNSVYLGLTGVICQGSVIVIERQKTLQRAEDLAIGKERAKLHYWRRTRE